MPRPLPIITVDANPLHFCTEDDADGWAEATALLAQARARRDARLSQTQNAPDLLEGQVGGVLHLAAGEAAGGVDTPIIPRSFSLSTASPKEPDYVFSLPSG